jgi:hypothetical protein
MVWMGGAVCGCGGAGVAGGIGIGICICMVCAAKPRTAKRAEQAPKARPRKVRRVLIMTPYEAMAKSTEWDRRDADLR